MEKKIARKRRQSWKRGMQKGSRLLKDTDQDLKVWGKETEGAVCIQVFVTFAQICNSSAVPMSQVCLVQKFLCKFCELLTLIVMRTPELYCKPEYPQGWSAVGSMHMLWGRLGESVLVLGPRAAEPWGPICKGGDPRQGICTPQMCLRS